MEPTAAVPPFALKGCLRVRRCCSGFVRWGPISGRAPGRRLWRDLWFEGLIDYGYYMIVGFTCLALTNVLIHLTFRALAFSSSQRHSAACFFSWMRLIRSSERLGSPGLE